MRLRMQTPRTRNWFQSRHALNERHVKACHAIPLSRHAMQKRDPYNKEILTFEGPLQLRDLHFCNPAMQCRIYWDCNCTFQSAVACEHPRSGT